MWFLAIRQLLARKKQTAFVIAGILLGSGAYITISGIMLGFQTYMIERLIDNDGHIHISARQQDIVAQSLEDPFFGANILVKWIKPPSGRRDHSRIEHPAGWFDLLDQDLRVVGYSPQLVVQALAQRGTLSASVRVIGVDPVRHEQVTHINEFLADGKHLAELGRSGNRIIIGKGLLSKLGAAVGENILLSVAGAPPLSFRIINTFEFGMPNADDAMIYGSVADIQKLNRTPSQLSDITVRLTDVSLAAPMAKSLALLSSDKVQSWDQENEGILSIFTLQTMIRNLMSVCILLVAGFGIYNILNMIVSQKRKEIGILRSMGYMGKEISQLFLYQGIIFGVFGGLLGMLAGYLMVSFIHTRHIGTPGTTTYRPITVTYDIFIYIKAFMLAMGASIIAGWIPARSAGRMNPIDIIRSDGG